MANAQIEYAAIIGWNIIIATSIIPIKSRKNEYDLYWFLIIFFIHPFELDCLIFYLFVLYFMIVGTCRGLQTHKSKGRDCLTHWLYTRNPYQPRNIIFILFFRNVFFNKKDYSFSSTIFFTKKEFPILAFRK
jgi:hypothetical protein